MTNTITQINGDSEEVRVSTQTKTFVFGRQGFHMSTGCSVTLDELQEVAELLRDQPLSKTHKIIINLTLWNYREKIKQIA